MDSRSRDAAELRPDSPAQLRSARAAARQRLVARAPRAPDAPARGGRDAAVHARRHQCHGQGARSGRPARGRRQHDPGQHVPPLPSPRPRAHRPAGRPAQVHGLGPADPDRLGRVPGRLAWASCARSTTTASRSRATSTARTTASRPNTRSPSRRRSARTWRSRSTSRCRRPHRPVKLSPRRCRARICWAARSLAAHSRPDQALFGIIQGGLDPELRAESTRFMAGLPFDGHLHRRPGRRRDAGRALRRRGRGGRSAPGRPAAALPDGPRFARRPARGGPSRRGHVRLACCRRGSPATASSGSRAAGSTFATPSSRTTRGRSRRVAAACSAGSSHGPIWPIFSVPRSCSPTASRLVTT